MDTIDTVTLDVPLLIRLLELAREEIKSDAELHEVATRIIEKSKERTLTMTDYNYLSGRVVEKDVLARTLQRLQATVI